MKNKFVLFLLAFYIMNVRGQVITIKDIETEATLEMVSIMQHNPNLVLTSNSKGQIDISQFKGATRLDVFAMGYKKKTVSYEILNTENGVFQLEKLELSLDAIIVSSSRWNQSVKEIPFKVTSISPIDVELQNPQTAADLLGGSGEVFIQKSQLGGGSPMIRGFSTNRLVYSIDGVRMNTAIFRGGNLQNVISLDPFAIEHTEVLFGPGSVIYGSDAIGGVMSFQTLTPQLSLSDEPLISGKAVARTASASNELSTHFDVGVGWKKWALVSSFTASQFGDLKMGSYGPDEYLRPYFVQRIDSMDAIIHNPDSKIQTPTGYSQINMMQKVRFQPNDKWDIQYGFHFSETSSYSRYDRHIRYKDGLPRYGEWAYGPQKWMMNNLSISNSGNTKMYDQMSIRLAHQFFEESRISRDFNKNDRETRIENVDAYSASIDFNKSLGERNQFFYGGEFILNNVRSTGIDEDISTGLKQAGPARYPQSNWMSYAVYLSNQFKMNEKLMFQGGLRYSHYQLEAAFDTTFYPFPFSTASIANGALTGSFGMVYQPTTTWVISLNASTGFRSPNVDDVGKVFDSEPGAVVIPNPNLKAEYVYNGDISITKVLGSFAKVDVTGFYTYLDNALVRRDFTLNGQDSLVYDGELSQIQALQNAALTEVYGLQAGLEVMFGAGFSLLSKYNFQIGEEELDNGTTSPSRHAAPWFGVTRLNYKRGKVNLQFYALYSGGKTFEQLPFEEQGKAYLYARDENGNPYSPAWYTLNFKAMYKINENFTVNAGVENIADKRYKTYSSGIVSPGRNVIISLKANF